MIVWGGGGSGPFYNTGGRYDPTTDAWVPTSTNGAPDARAVHVAVWTGTEMIVWGGLANGSTYLATGGRYNPATDTWLPTSLKNAPDARVQHTAVWTGKEMIVWGGRAYYRYFNTGARYNPDSDTWTPTNVDGAPTPRTQHTAVWTGTEMIVWGGGYEFPLNAGDGYDPAAENTGGRYDPATDTWVATSTDGAPEARANQMAVWTGTEMIIWAGGGSHGPLYSGGHYDPVTDSWTTMSPFVHLSPKAVWSGREMIFWGGSGPIYSNVGGRYEPINDVWVSIGGDAPLGRGGHTAVWTDTEMIVWGGGYAQEPGYYYLNTGGRYCAFVLTNRQRASTGL